MSFVDFNLLCTFSRVIEIIIKTALLPNIYPDGFDGCTRYTVHAGHYQISFPNTSSLLSRMRVPLLRVPGPHFSHMKNYILLGKEEPSLNRFGAYIDSIDTRPDISWAQ